MKSAAAKVASKAIPKAASEASSKVTQQAVAVPKARGGNGKATAQSVQVKINPLVGLSDMKACLIDSFIAFNERLKTDVAFNSWATELVAKLGMLTTYVSPDEEEFRR